MPLKICTLSSRFWAGNFITFLGEIYTMDHDDVDTMDMGIMVSGTMYQTNKGLYHGREDMD
jgi:hypothetical protein